jgi:hypothetical protein
MSGADETAVAEVVEYELTQVRDDLELARTHASEASDALAELLAELEARERDAVPLDSVLREVAAERAAQHAVWGEQNLLDGTGPDVVPFENWDVVMDGANVALTTAEHLAVLCSHSECVTWLDVLLEEVLEAFAESDRGRLRAELIQVAAVAVQWVEAIDRRADQEAMS